MAGSIHDDTALQTMDIGLPTKSRLYAGAAYLNGGIKGLLSESRMVSLKAATKKNSAIRNTWAEGLENKYFRKRIENTFSEINASFPRKIHAVTAAGFLLKLFIAIIALLLHKAMN